MNLLLRKKYAKILSKNNEYIGLILFTNKNEGYMINFLSTQSFRMALLTTIISFFSLQDNFATLADNQESIELDQLQLTNAQENNVQALNDQKDPKIVMSDLARRLEQEFKRAVGDRVETLKEHLTIEQLHLLEKRILEQQEQLKSLEKLGSSLEKLSSKKSDKKEEFQTIRSVMRKSFGEAFKIIQNQASRLFFAGLDATGAYAALLLIAATLAECALPGAGLLLVTTAGKVIALLVVNGISLTTSILESMVAVHAVAGPAGLVAVSTGTGYGLYTIYGATLAALSAGATITYNFFGQELAVALMAFL